MSTATEEQIEYKQSLSLLSHDELTAMKGDNDEEDALIDEILAAGKAVATKAKAPGDDVVDAEDPAGKEAKVVSDKAKAPGDAEDADDDDDDPAAPSAAAKPAATPTAAEAEAAAAAALAQAETDAAAAAAAADAPAVEIPKLDLGFVDTKYSTKMAALDAEKATQFQALMDGTIDAATFSTFESGYMQQRDVLRDQKTDEKAWFGHVHSFKTEQANTIGLNYFADAVAADALNDWTVRIASKPENREKTPEWCLAEAHKKVLNEIDFKPAAAKPADKAAPAAAAAAPTKAAAAAPAPAVRGGRAPKLNDIPPTIGGLPAASSAAEADGGEFAHLDSLSGMAYEQAVARLTPDQRERWASV